LTQLLLQYSYLQLLDLLTTTAFLLNGIEEGNPVVRMAMQHSPHPLVGLLLVKTVAVILGMYCWWDGRERLLTRMNWLFAALIAWNLVALIARSAVGWR
jgi:hypothetical protein